jgi:hypothetical protein
MAAGAVFPKFGKNIPIIWKIAFLAVAGKTCRGIPGHITES